MFCEPHRKALSEAALVGARPPARIEAHLASCAACCQAFADEQALLRRIDAAVRSVAESETPASLIPGVRGRIADLAESRSNWRLVLGYATAALVAGVIATSFGMRGKGSQAPLGTPSAITRPAAEVPVPAGNAPRGNARVNLLTAERRPAGGRLERRNKRPEVLISGDDRLGLDKYVASFRMSASGGKATLKEEAGPGIKPIEIVELDTARLSIDPLESGDSN